jgi:hypothetical protein
VVGWYHHPYSQRRHVAGGSSNRRAAAASIAARSTSAGRTLSLSPYPLVGAVARLPLLFPGRCRRHGRLGGAAAVGNGEAEPAEVTAYSQAR